MTDRSVSSVLELADMKSNPFILSVNLAPRHYQKQSADNSHIFDKQSPALLLTGLIIKHPWIDMHEGVVSDGHDPHKSAIRIVCDHKSTCDNNHHCIQKPLEFKETLLLKDLQGF